MNEREIYRVIVGVDGSDSALAAVSWAAREALTRHGTLRIVHAWLWPLMHVPLGPAPGVTGGGLRADAHRVLEHAMAAAAAATAEAPELEVHADLVTGAPQAVLLDASHDADLLVLGDRGLDGFTGMLMGSVAVAMAHRAICPVVIVRGNVSPDGAIVVGVDGSASDRAVLATAFGRAAREGTQLLVVHAWDAPHSLLPALPWSGEASGLQREAQLRVDDALAPLRVAYPDVAVGTRLVTVSPTAALVAASDGARMVMVGSHGAGALRGFMAGSVCHGVIYHARCPVEVVRIPAGDRPGSAQQAARHEASPVAALPS